MRFLARRDSQPAIRTSAYRTASRHDGACVGKRYHRLRAGPKKASKNPCAQ